MATTIPTERAAQKAIDSLLTDGVRMREADRVLNTYLQKTRGVSILQYHGGDWLVASRPPEVLFRNVSHSACLEYALKLPTKEAE
jgi:hypothetical protein